MKDQNRKKEDLIDELKLLRALLKKSDRDKQALSALIRYSPLAIICLDKDGQVIVWNPAAEQIFGWKEEEVLGRKNPIVPVDKKEEYRGLQEAVRQGNPYFSKELRRRKKDGTIVYLNAASASLRDSQDKVTALVGIFEDITERKRQDEAVWESEERFRRAFENAAVGASIVDMRGRFIKINRRLCEMLGYSEEELLQKTFSDVTYPEDIPKGMDALAKLMRGEVEHVSIEKRYIRKDGRIIHGIVSPSSIHDENGKPTHCLGLWQDITVQKWAEEQRTRAEEALREANARLLALVHAIPDMVYFKDCHGRFMMVNRAFEKFVGASEGTMIGKTDEDFMPPDLAEYCRKSDEELIKGRGIVHVEEAMTGKDGGKMYFDTVKTPIYDSGGNLLGLAGVSRDVTERRLKDDALRESEERFRGAFENAAVGASMIDMKGRFIKVNRRLCEILGYTQEELLSKTFSDVTHPEDVRIGVDALAKQMAGEADALSFEKRYIHRDGHVVHMIVSPSVIRDRDGKPTHCVGMFQNITQRKQAEESLLLFRNLLNKSNDAITVNDPVTGRLLMVNDKACSNLGYERSELLTKRTLDIESIFPDQAAWGAHVSEVKSKGYLILEGMNRRRDGTLFPVEVNVTYMTVGGTDYMVAVLRDITERKASEQALRISEERLSKAQKMAHVGNWEENYATGRLYWSEEVYHIYGVDPATFTPTLEAVGKAMHPDDLGPFVKAVNAALYERKHFEMDYRLIRPDGTIRTVHTIGKVSYDQAGKPVVHAGTVQDITEQKKAEEKLRQSEEFIRNILDTVDEGFIVVDHDYRILTANKAYCDQAGESYGTVIGRHCYEISHKSQRPCFEEREECAVRNVFMTGEPWTSVHRHTDAEGTILHVETKAFPVKDGTGAVTSVIETVNNVTERHLLEEERLKTQKLEAIGTLAGGIAHDFNNLLQGVFGYISMARITFDQKDRSLAMLTQAEQALQMSVNLTKQLLTFSKGGKPVKTKVSLRSVIDNSVKFALSGSRVDYRIVFDQNLRTVEADEGQIGQVIQNVVLNADQAMPQGGTIVITAKNVQAPDPLLPHLLKKGNYVEISIQDNGIGIPAPDMHKIFDPYFTTKQKGSGLGLATSYSIIKNHGGLIDVVSRTGTGTICFIYLPATDAGIEVQKNPSVSPAVRQGKILVMDDEEVVRNIVGEMLKALGHAVEFAEHGDAAIEKYQAAREAGNPFDIVILDLTVRGGLGGKETNNRLLAIDPGARVIVSSGYSDDAVMADHRAHGFAACLRKPYQLDELVSTLNALLT